jgi:hypothetical protein
MVAIQPTYGDKTYWSSRVLAKNAAGLWQMMESSQLCSGFASDDRHTQSTRPEVTG